MAKPSFSLSILLLACKAQRKVGTSALILGFLLFGFQNQLASNLTSCEGAEFVDLLHSWKGQGEEVEELEMDRSSREAVLLKMSRLKQEARNPAKMRRQQ